MALIECHECKKDVSSLAKSCPNCGNPIAKTEIVAPQNNINKKPKKKRKGCLGCLSIVGIGIVSLFALLYISSFFIDDDPNAWKTHQSRNLSYTLMQDFVKDRLKSPRTAKFPNIFTKDEHVNYLGNQKYEIDSYVDSENSFGAVIRTHFIGVIEQKDEDTWSLISLELFD